MALQRTATSPFEPVFARHAGAIPLPYLRALAYKESGFRPDIIHPTSRATGLFQITRTALESFNIKSGTAHSLAHLINPELNTRVAASHLASVINGYRRLRSLAPDWSSRRWVELLTLGWNAGHNAVIALVARMEASGMPPERITVDTVSELARATGRGKYVADPARVAWAKSVASVFLGGGAVPSRRGPLVASMVPSGRGGALALAFGALMAGVALVFGRPDQADTRKEAHHARG
jgi:hypothetical protein